MGDMATRELRVHARGSLAYFFECGCIIFRWYFDRAAVWEQAIISDIFLFGDNGRGSLGWGKFWAILSQFMRGIGRVFRAIQLFLFFM
jgi:hypothetical protein